MTKEKKDVKVKAIMAIIYSWDQKTNKNPQRKEQENHVPRPSAE